jgi:hypothetical protein
VRKYTREDVEKNEETEEGRRNEEKEKIEGDKV